MFESSLAETAVDRCSHTWAFLSLLFLSLVTLLVPLSPLLQKTSPEYVASCWCPAEFTGAMVQYTNSICGRGYTSALQGRQKTSSLGVQLYVPSEEFTENLPGPKFSVDVIDSSRFYFVKTPLAMFLFAVGLKGAHFMWMLLASFAGINIAKTLKALKISQCLDKNSRRQLMEDVIRAIRVSTNAQSSFSSLLFLLFKILISAVLVGELLVIYLQLMPQATSQIDELSQEDNRILFCEFNIRQLQNVKSFTVQCNFEQRPTINALSTGSQDQSPVGGSDFTHSPAILHMYECLYTIVLTLILILLIANVVDLIAWIIKLVMGPCQIQGSHKYDLSLDARLLVHLARDNVGHEVARDLADGLSRGGNRERSDTGDAGDIPLHE